MDIDPDPFLRGIKARKEAEAKAITKRQGEALLEAARLARAFRVGVPALKKIFLFGSVAENRAVNLNFDIDIAIIGGDRTAVESIAEGSSFHIDIWDFERLPDLIRKNVMEKGREL
jgi:predicted nucleotidyltransferase